MLPDTLLSACQVRLRSDVCTTEEIFLGTHTHTHTCKLSISTQVEAAASLTHQLFSSIKHTRTRMHKSTNTDSILQILFKLKIFMGFGSDLNWNENWWGNIFSGHTYTHTVGRVPNCCSCVHSDSNKYTWGSQIISNLQSQRRTIYTSHFFS